MIVPMMGIPEIGEEIGIESEYGDEIWWGTLKRRDVCPHCDADTLTIEVDGKFRVLTRDHEADCPTNR